MKKIDKIENIAAGVFFLVYVALHLKTVVRFFTTPGMMLQICREIPRRIRGHKFSLDLFLNDPYRSLIISLGVILVLIMGIIVLRQKKMGMVSMVLSWVYLSFLAYELIFFWLKIGHFAVFIKYPIHRNRLIYFVVLLLAMILSQYTNVKERIREQKEVGMAISVAMSRDKQGVVYDELLRANILTREEYNQVIQNREQVLAKTEV